MSRRKGARGERQIIDLLQPVVNDIYDVCHLEAPVLKRNSLQSDGGGSDIAGLPWLAAEVKLHAKVLPSQVHSWWAQTLEQAGMDREPVLFYRRNSASWSVQMLGMLGGPGWGHTTPVTVSVEHFLVWFRSRLYRELVQ